MLNDGSNLLCFQSSSDKFDPEERARREREEKELEWQRLQRDKELKQLQQQRERELERRLQPEKGQVWLIHVHLMTSLVSKRCRSMAETAWAIMSSY